MIPHVAVQIHWDWGNNWTWLEGHHLGAQSVTLVGRFWVMRHYLPRRWGGEL